MKARIKIVEDSNKIIEKHGLFFFNDVARVFSSNVHTKIHENDLLFKISKEFKENPEKLHHSYLKDLLKQIKFTLIFE